MHRVDLAVELEGLVDGGAVSDRLHVPHDPEAVLEADDGALIETEKIAGVIAEAAVPQIAVEPVGELKARAEPRQPQGGRQGNHAEIRFGELQRTIVVGSRRGRLAGGVGRRR